MCGAGAAGHWKGLVHRASSTSCWVPGLNGEQEEMGAPLAFPARHAKLIPSIRC